MLAQSWWEKKNCLSFHVPLFCNPNLFASFWSTLNVAKQLLLYNDRRWVQVVFYLYPPWKSQHCQPKYEILVSFFCFSRLNEPDSSQFSSHSHLNFLGVFFCFNFPSFTGFVSGHQYSCKGSGAGTGQVSGCRCLLSISTGCKIDGNHFGYCWNVFGMGETKTDHDTQSRETWYLKDNSKEIYQSAVFISLWFNLFLCLNLWISSMKMGGSKGKVMVAPVVRCV